MGRGERLLRSVYEHKRLGRALYVFSAATSLAVAAALAVWLGFLAFYEQDFLEIFRIIFTAGVPFFIVGGVRRAIGAKRPYEVYSFYEECPKRRFFGREETSWSASFPSRHAYSAFVISTVLFFDLPLCAAVLGVLSLFMCASRVLLGIHYIRDVVAGMLIGVSAGVLGEFLLNF